MRTLSRNQLIIGFILGAILLIGVIVLIGTANQSREEHLANLPTPTPTATPIPQVVDCRVLGGQIYLNDPEVIQILENDYKLRCRAESMGSFQMVAAETSYEGVDAVWTGSKAAYELLLQNHPGSEKDHDTVFITFLMNFTWKSYLEQSIAAGLVQQEGSAYTMDLSPIAQAILTDKTWADLGAPGIPGYVNFRYSAPESSGGGLSSLYLLGAYLTPRTEGSPPRPIRIEDLTVMLPQLKRLWLAAGQQADSSPENFDEFVTKGYPWVISSESLFIGWLTKLPVEQQARVLELVVGVYPEYTMSTDHILVALTPAGQKLLDAFRNDPRLHQIGWDKYGMRLGIGGLGAKPGDTTLPWILPNPRVIPDPKEDVTTVVKPELK